jgi:hypothetical protein
MIYGEKKILIRGLNQDQNINEHCDTSPAQNIEEWGKTPWVEGCAVTSTGHRLFMYKEMVHHPMSRGELHPLRRPGLSMRHET